MYRSIMVPLDGSVFSEHALPLALSVARHAGATVQLTHIHTAASPLYDAAGLPSLDGQIELRVQKHEHIYLRGIVQRRQCRGESRAVRVRAGVAASAKWRGPRA